jgi:tetratricopeptide (TPR) repeat protein
LAVAVLLVANGYTVYVRNGILRYNFTVWADNVEKSPRLSSVHSNLGNAYWVLGMYEDAYSEFYRAYVLDRYTNIRQKGVVLSNLGRYRLYVTKEYGRSLSWFEKSLAIYPAYFPAWHGAGLSLLGQNRVSEAEAVVDQAILYWPKIRQFKDLADLVASRKATVH